MPHITDTAIAERLRSIRSDLRAENGEISQNGSAYVRGQLHVLLLLELITDAEYEELYALSNPARGSSSPH